MTTTRFPSTAGRTAVSVALAEDASGNDITPRGVFPKT